MSPKIVSYLTISIICLYSNAQENMNALTKLNQEIGFIPIIHASLYFNVEGVKVFVDPWGEEERYTGLGKADVILITDVHQDHYSEKNIQILIKPETRLYVPQAVYDMMSDELKEKASVMNNGEEVTIEGTEILLYALPMYNLPESSEAFHVKGRGNGYIMERKNFRIYISGDTEDIPEMRSLQNIDVAFVCMNQPYTMTVEQAAEVVVEFRPRLVYPYHFRNGDKTLSDVQRFSEIVEEQGVKCVLSNWYSEVGR